MDDAIADRLCAELSGKAGFAGKRVVEEMDGVPRMFAPAQAEHATWTAMPPGDYFVQISPSTPAAPGCTLRGDLTFDLTP